MGSKKQTVLPPKSRPIAPSAASPSRPPQRLATPASTQRSEPASERKGRWSNDVTAARYRGQLMAKRIHAHGKLSAEAEAKVAQETAYFEGAAREAYIHEVEPTYIAVAKKSLSGPSSAPHAAAPIDEQAIADLAAIDPSIDVAHRHSVLPTARLAAGAALAAGGLVIGLGRAGAQNYMNTAAANTGRSSGKPSTRLEALGNFLFDPSGDGAHSVPLSERFHMTQWRQTIRDAANAKKVGDTYKYPVTTQKWNGILGTYEDRTYYEYYKKQPDNTWVHVECDGCEPGDTQPDLNLIIDPNVSDDRVKDHLQLRFDSGIA